MKDFYNSQLIQPLRKTKIFGLSQQTFDPSNFVGSLNSNSLHVLSYLKGLLCSNYETDSMGLTVSNLLNFQNLSLNIIFWWNIQNCWLK